VAQLLAQDLKQGGTVVADENRFPVYDQ